MTNVYEFACCEHCGCPPDERVGHDDTCRYGCNDLHPVTGGGVMTPAELLGEVVRATLSTDRKLTEKRARLIRDAVREAGGDITQLAEIARRHRLRLVYR